MQWILTLFFSVFSFLSFSQTQNGLEGNRANITKTHYVDSALTPSGPYSSLTNLRGADLRFKYLEEAQFQGKDLHQAQFTRSFLKRANFKEAKLQKTHFYQASLIDADFKEANLKGAVFLDSDLRGADFTNANLEGVQFDNSQYSMDTKGLSKEHKSAMKLIKPSCNKNIKVTHFQQVHEHPSIKLPHYITPMISKSQFHILQTLLDYQRQGKKFVVFDEEEVNEVRAGIQKNSSNKISKAFQSIPKSHKLLSSEQKKILIKKGAARVLYFLDRINHIHKVISDRDWSLFKSHRIHAFFYFMHAFREKKLKEEVDFFLNEYKKKHEKDYDGEIVIIYGAAHNLSDEFKDCSFQTVNTFYLNPF